MAGPEGLLFDDPAIEGTYVIEGERITVSVDPGSRQCRGLRFAMLASVPAPNVAHLVSVGRASDDCSSPEGTRTILQQLLPTHPEPAGWGPPQKGDVDWPPAGWQVPERGTALHGDWLMEGGGYLLEVNPDGNYHVADDSGQPIDSGDWTLRDGELTLVSGSGSTACSAGDRLVQGVELVLAYHGPGIADTPFMRTTVQRDACGVAWAGAGWMKY
jgi:hypothetical protein